MAFRGPHLTQYQHSNRLTTAPTAEPISVSFLKEHTRQTLDVDDAYLTDLIGEARKLLEDATGLALITQTWQLTLDDWPFYDNSWWSGTRQIPRSELYASGRAVGEVKLPRYPLQSITSVTTYDEADTSTAVTVGTSFIVDVQSYPGRLRLRSGQTWPTATRETNAVEIVYVAGFGDATDVPAPLKRAVAVLAGYLYQHRGDDCSPSEALTKSGALELASGYAEARL